MTSQTGVEVSTSPEQKPPEKRSALEFQSNYGPNSNPFDYPGEIPSYSYLLDTEQGSDTVVDPLVLDVNYAEGATLGERFITKNSDGESVTLDELLDERGVPGIAERIPVVAYGANQNPRSLLIKFEVADRPDLAIVPALNAQIQDFMPVAHSKPGIRGNVFAELAKFEGAQSSVKVIFLTPEQLIHLHKSEPQYDAGVLTDANLTLADGTELPAIVYAGNAPVLLDEVGRPIGFESIVADDAGINTMSSEEMLGEMLNVEGVINAVNTVAPGFEELMAESSSHTQAYAELMRRCDANTKARMAAGEKLERSEMAEVQLAVKKVLEEHGRLGSSALSDSIIPLSRTLPDTWPTMGQIEQGSWSPEQSGHTNPDDEFYLGRLASQVITGDSEKERIAAEAAAKYVKQHLK